MAITGTGHNGITTFSLEAGVLTLTGPGGSAKVRVNDMVEYGGQIESFNALAGHAVVMYTVWGQSERREIPLGELHVLPSSMI